MGRVRLTAGVLLAATALAGCGGGGTGGGKMDIRELENSGEQYDSVFEDGQGAEDAAVERYRNGGAGQDEGAVDGGVVYDCRMVISPVDGEVEQVCDLFEAETPG